MRFVEEQPRVADIVFEGCAVLLEIGDHILGHYRLCAVGVDNGQVFPFNDIGKALFEQGKIFQFPHAESLFQIFIRIYGRDAALGRAEFFVGKALFFEAVLLYVVRHGDDRAVGYFQVLWRNFYARFAQARHLPRKVLDVDDHSGPHDAHDAFAQYSRRQKVENKPAALVDDGMPRIVTALITADDVVIFG